MSSALLLGAVAAANLGFVAAAAPYGWYVPASIPWFLAAMAIESCLRPAPEPGAAYVGRDVVHSLFAGLTQQIVVLLAAGLAPGPPGPPAAPLSPAAWAALFVGLDLTYYALHRASHEVQWLWVGHAVHHSSQHYNLAMALRQSWWQALAGLPALAAWTLVAPPRDVAAIWQLNGVYQFWVHTCHVDRLPLGLERVLNAPAHHRVHHDWRVHKNFGGVFIVWDRMLGTFLDEPAVRPACSFGTRTPAPPPLDDAVEQTAELMRGGLRGAGPGGRGLSTADRRLVPSRRNVPAPFTTLGTAEAAVAAAAIGVGLAAVMLGDRRLGVAALCGMHVAANWLA